MKFFILLSLVALCSCSPAHQKQNKYEQSKNAVQGNNPYNTFWKTYSQQRQGEEPWNQWAQYGQDNQAGNYWRQYVQGKNQVGGATVPWIYHYWDNQDYENLSPAQRVQLVLNYMQVHQQWNQLNSDVNNEDYLHQLMYQHLPEYVQYNHEDVLPHLVQYFEQNPARYTNMLHQAYQYSQSQQQLMYHVMYQLYQHYGQAPWSQEQIRNQIVKYQSVYPHQLSQGQIEQLVEFVYHIQQELTPRHYQQLEQVQPQLENYLEQSPMSHQQYPWSQRQLMYHVMYELYHHYGQAPWSQEQIRNHIVQYQNAFPNQLSQEQIEQLVGFVYNIQQELMPMHYQQLEQMQPWGQYTAQPSNYQTYYSRNNQNGLSWTYRQAQQGYGSAQPWTYRQTQQGYQSAQPWTYSQTQQRYEAAQPWSYRQTQQGYEGAQPWSHYQTVSQTYGNPLAQYYSNQQNQQPWTQYWNRYGQQYQHQQQYVM
ncbi:bromodomain-containing protein DDB_G0280777-like [Diabrotica virgifera virgifera]|uniref:Bromodomain-containing protein DDB_G0280777-like n=1 Tax=Diabrotica virgifera virgifera TaxID=50390 RepID=A0A6P7FK59_DIAVI|nr:bromodomain-containing protein DDB_G0280777-like [Diabrotica virgifera virgifera]